MSNIMKSDGFLEKTKNFTCARVRVRAVIKQGYQRTKPSICKAFSPFYIKPNMGTTSITSNSG